jgi:hypothetical protein
MNISRLIRSVLIVALLSICSEAACRQDTIETTGNEYEIMLDDAYDHNDYFHKLHHLKEYRLNINTCTLQKLLAMPLISFETATAIISYREKHEKFFSLRELFMIDNADSVEISSVLPYLRTGFEPDTKRSERNYVASPYKLSLITRAINSSQMAETYGSGMKALRTYSSIRVSYGDSIHLGACIEKDAGEKNLLDYKSFYFRYNNLWGTDYILLGDYVAEFGKGLLVWAPFRQMRNANSGNPQLGFGQGIREHSGTSESLFLRGAAVGLHFDYLRLEYFFSHRSIDASFDSAGSFISYISLSGYHRTPLEVTRQSSATENLAGTIMTLSNYRTYEMKLLLLYDAYSAPLAQKLNIPQRALSGSLSYAFSRKSIFINGEIGHNNNTSGLITNIKLNPVATSTLLMSYRNYAASFLGIHSSAFGSTTANTYGEEGFYSGIHLSYRDFGLDSYVDFSKTLKADNYGLCYHQSEYFTAGSLNNSSKLAHKIGVTYTINEYSKKGLLYIVKSNVSHLLTWYDLEYKAVQHLNIKSRIALAHIQDSTQHRGFVSYLQLKYKLNTTTNISGRIYFYNSDNYASGFYVAEGEVPGYVTTSHLYNDGSRYFIALSTVLLNHVHISFKAAAQRNTAFNQDKYSAQYSLQCELRY